MFVRAWKAIRKRRQPVINILVLMQTVAIILVGTMALRGRETTTIHETTPASEEVGLDVSSLMEIMDYALNPTLLAGIVNNHPELVNGLIAELDPGILAGGINSNPEFVPRLLNRLEPGTVEVLISQSSAFLDQVVGALDPQVLAGVINSHPDLVSLLVTSLDPSVLAGSLNSDSVAGWLSTLFSRLNPTVLAGIINANQGLLRGLLARLDPVGMAASLNSSPQFINGLVSNLDLSALDPVMLADLVNAHPDWMGNLLSHLDPAAMASVLANNQDFVVNLFNAMGSESLAELVNALAAGPLGSVVIMTHVCLDAPVLDMLWFNAKAILSGSTVQP
ncbi:MAG: hypothetical protein H5T72_10845 [Actinobacteria bacterium]|nr:hypothetical protein [Actinomycetota bacterium]